MEAAPPRSGSGGRAHRAVLRPRAGTRFSGERFSKRDCSRPPSARALTFCAHLASRTVRRTSSGRVPRPAFGFVVVHSRGAPVERSWRGRGYTRDRAARRPLRRATLLPQPLPCTPRRRSAASEAPAATKALLIACGGIGGASDAEKLCSRWRVRILYCTRALAENDVSKRMPVRGERPLRTRQLESKVEPKLRGTAAAPLARRELLSVTPRRVSTVYC